MGVYIKRYGDYVTIGSQIPQVGYEWYDGEIPQLIDYELQYHKWEDGKVVVGHRYSEDELRQQALEINLQKYKEFCKDNDNEYIKYLKRKELNIAKDKDKNDYDNAFLKYKQKTEEYNATKDAIMVMTIEELERWIHENSQFNTFK